MITILAGGTGSAKFIRGIAQLIPQEKLTIISNVADNIKIYGLYVCPDIDTILYLLAGLLDKIKGWGIIKDSFNLNKMLAKYGCENWFKIGDSDLATHLYRTQLINDGLKLSEATEIMKKKLNIKARILPATDEWVETKILTENDEIHLQEFWVKNKAQDKILKIIYENTEKANPAPGVIDAIENAKAIIISPANPITSIKPILAVRKITDALKNSRTKTLAISPIIGESPISGPAGKLMKDLGYKVSPLTVISFYRDFIKFFLIDTKDSHLKERINSVDIKCIPTNITMTNLEQERCLAKFALETLRLDW